MSSRTVMVLSVIGIAIGGAQGYWQLHSVDLVYDVRFILGLVFGILSPVGTYFVGLAQKAPWDTNAMVKGSTSVTVTETPPQDNKP